jgi:hypothetical protein
MEGAQARTHQSRYLSPGVYYVLYMAQLISKFFYGKGSIDGVGGPQRCVMSEICKYNPLKYYNIFVNSKNCAKTCTVNTDAKA